jgi:DNA-binding MarR family transcriptional regulator
MINLIITISVKTLKFASRIKMRVSTLLLACFTRQKCKKMTLEEELKNSKPIAPNARAVLNIIFTASWLDCLMSRSMRPYGLTNPQYNILRILKGSYPRGLSVLDIKSRMLDRSSNVSRLVEKLREQGLAERTPSADDRRMVVVNITEKGLDLLEHIGVDIFDNQGQHPGGKMTEAELVQLGLLLDKIRE